MKNSTRNDFNDFYVKISSFRNVNLKATKKSSRATVRDHSGHFPVQYLKNIGPAMEQSYWLSFVIGPRNYLSRVRHLNNTLPIICYHIYYTSIAQDGSRLMANSNQIIHLAKAFKKFDTCDTHINESFRKIQVQIAGVNTLSQKRATIVHIIPSC